MAAPTLQPKPYRALALIRKSTNAQDNKRQHADIEKLKKKFGLEIVETIELDGVSGRKVLKNEEFQRLLDEMPHRSDYDGLALSAIDRFFRTDRFDDPRCFQPLAESKKRIWSIVEGEVEPWSDEGFNTCMTAALKSGAEWRELRRRTVDGKQELAEAGFLPHGNAWFGVDIIGRRHTGTIGEGKAVINEREAEIAREGYARVAAGTEATYAIIADWNRRGILNKGSNGHPPAAWSRNTFLQMIRSTNYIGKHMWKGTEITVPRIVDDETWYAANAALGKEGKRKKQWSGRPGKVGLFRKFTSCGECGHTGGRDHNNYRCANTTNKPPIKRLCPARGFNQVIVDRVGWAAIYVMLKTPEMLLEMGHAHYAGQMDPNQQLIGELTGELKRLEQNDRNLSRMMKQAGSDEEYSELSGERNELRVQIASIELRLRNASKVINMPPLAVLQAYVNKIVDGPEPSTYERRRSILEGLEDLRVTLGHDEHGNPKMTITGKVPVSDKAADAGTDNGRNCKRRVHADSSYVQSIPFILNPELPPDVQRKRTRRAA